MFGESQPLAGGYVTRFPRDFFRMKGEGGREGGTSTKDTAPRHQAWVPSL